MRKLRILCLLTAIALMICPLAMAETATATGTGAGNGGKITVSVTLEDGKLTAIEVLSQSETPVISDPAFEQIPQAILDAQSVTVDVVTGATNTSNGLIAAVTAALEAAGADMDAFTKAAQAEAEEAVHTDLTADVVIVGGGGAGLAAAVAATDKGASVILIEKTSSLGGNTIVSGGIYNCPDPELLPEYEMTDGCAELIEAALAEEPVSEEHAALQQALREEYDAYKASGATSRFDSANWYALQTWNGGDKVADLKLVQNMADKSYEGYQWVREKGMTFNGKLTQGAGSLYPRTHTSTDILGTGYINTYTNDLAKKGELYTVLMNTSGKKLLTDGDRVVGVYAEDSKGNTYNLYANHDVILATGGFAGNVEMRQEYNTSGKWATLDASLPTTNVAGVTGDGIAMAREIGVNLVDMEQIQLMYLGNPKDGSTSGMTLRDATADYVVFVNKNGERFIREDGRRDELSSALLKQPDGLMYIVESAADYDIETAKTMNGVSYRVTEEEGDMLIADTLDELAEKIGCDPETLKATMAAYNAAVDAGVDEATGRVLLVNKIEEGPFVAVPRVVTVHHTMGGIQIDTECHALRADGSIVEGLLACGETTGGIHGGNRVGGNALVDTVVYGKIAGETAAENR